MTKLIAVLIIVAVCWGGYEIFLFWDNYNHDRDLAEKERQQHQQAMNCDQLPGMPTSQLEDSYKIAVKHGAAGVRAWLRINGLKIQDPRRACIELDYVVLVSREDPAEARKVYAEVKARIPQDSPVIGRIKDMQNTYE